MGGMELPVHGSSYGEGEEKDQHRSDRKQPTDAAGACGGANSGRRPFHCGTFGRQGMGMVPFYFQ